MLYYKHEGINPETFKQICSLSQWFLNLMSNPAVAVIKRYRIMPATAWFD